MAWERSASKAIVHIDGDAFFASCEQAIHPEYRGKPVITGSERGIVAAASYEAKKFGIQRGVPLWEVRKRCPQAIIVPSDYETYSVLSERMFQIMRRFTPAVEEYGIDEGFADLTGLRRSAHCSYPELAYRIKQAIQSDLGLTVSVGLASTKVLAKLGSKWKKPDGFTVISRHGGQESFLRLTPAGSVWGIGPNTAAYLAKYGIHTAWDFTQKPLRWIEQHTTKPIQDIWHELNGVSVLPLVTAAKASYQSISKTKTFTPPSTDERYVFAQLVKNIENACIKARRYQLATKHLAIFLKTQQFRYQVVDCVLTRTTIFPAEILPIVRQQFAHLFVPKTLYRATGVVLFNLVPSNQLQLSLFESVPRLEKFERVYASVDQLAERYGKHTVFQGASLPAHQQSDQRQQQRLLANNTNTVIHNHHQRKFIGLPLLHISV